MARPHVEFIQSQHVAWAPAPAGSQRAGAELKVLNADPGTGEFTALVRYPAGWAGRLPEADRAEELFVLDGDLTIDGVSHRKHHYAYLPPAVGCDIRCPSGALVLSWSLAARPDGAIAIDDPPIIGTDTLAMPWDVSTNDPKLTHLYLARKVLRLDPRGDCRTYLLAGLPHGVPRHDLQVERHPHAEEMFLLNGSMSSPQGLMTPGAYFYRPRGIEHGHHASEYGFLMIMRSPGSNRVVTEWIGNARPVVLDAPFAPVLPRDAPTAWAEPRPWPQDY